MKKKPNDWLNLTKEQLDVLVPKFKPQLVGEPHPEKPLFTKEDMRKAFEAGENWGVTYSTWFTPTIVEDEAQFNKFIEENY